MSLVDAIPWTGPWDCAGSCSYAINKQNGKKMCYNEDLLLMVT